MSWGRPRRAAFALIAIAVGGVGVAAAEPAAVTIAKTPRAPAPHRHALYVEVLGKGGLWGLGYDYTLTPRFAVGAAASYYELDGERVMSLSPYAAVYPLGAGRHRWFVHAGPQIVRLERPSPVPEWPGMTETGVGAEMSSGYELRTRLLVRAFVMGTVGRGGAAPWLGGSVGLTF